MKATNVKQVLVAARWIINRFGWCQNSYHQTKNGHKFFTPLKVDPKTLGGSCLGGAIYLVEKSSDQLLYDAFDLIWEATGTDYASYNDAKGRTKKQVIALLDKLIKKA